MTLSPRVISRIDRDFPLEERATISQLLDEVVKPLGQGNRLFEERLAAAILLYSQGDYDRFTEGVEEAQHDWRDLLVYTELAHEGWEKRINEEFGAARAGELDPEAGN